MNNFFHRLSHLRVRTVVVVILLVTLLIAAGLFYLWLWAGKKMENIVTKQFNEQQLMLARKIADNVEVYIDLLEYQMVSCKQAYQVEALAPKNFRAFLTLQMNYLKDFGVLEIRQYDAKGMLEFVYRPGGPFVPLKQTTLTEKYLIWAKEEKNRNALLLTEIFKFSDRFEPEGGRGMGILTPLYSPSDRG